ncbi:MAG: MATE family efflux transporter [Pseudomonadota bacterium]
MDMETVLAMRGQSRQGEISHRRVITIAFPIVISNATIPLLGIADTAAVGQLGLAAPIGAVGIGAFILTALYWLFGFLRMGTVGLTSQALGRDDRAEADVLLTRAVAFGLAMGIGLIVLQWPLIAGALALAPGSDEVETLARGYLEIRIWSAPAMIAMYGITGWLIAHERTGAVLILQVWTNGLNIVLDFVFVLGFGWGVEGVAIATFIAEWSGLLVGAWLVRGVFLRPYWRDWTRALDGPEIARMVKVNTDLFFRTAMLEAIFVSFVFIGARLGDVTLAANQVLIQFVFVTAFSLDGLVFAAETLVGQAKGAQDRARFRRTVIITAIQSTVIVLALALVFAMAGALVIDLMTTAPAVRAEAKSFLIFMVLAPLIGGPAWIFDGIFIGATRTRDMRNMMVIAFAAYVIAALLLVGPLGNMGLWIALLVSFAVRGLTLGVRYPGLERDIAP